VGHVDSSQAIDKLSVPILKGFDCLGGLNCRVPTKVIAIRLIKDPVRFCAETASCFGSDPKFVGEWSKQGKLGVLRNYTQIVPVD
jgi:hypothetical protein